MPTDRAAAPGWAIQVTATNPTEVPAFAFFNVAVGDADKAVEAVRKRVGAKEGDRVYAVRPLSAGELEAADLRTGQLNPA